MLEPSECKHTYGFHYNGGIIGSDEYETYTDLIKFTYCPWCRTQLHTLDGEPLGILAKTEDDCLKGGCND